MPSIPHATSYNTHYLPTCLLPKTQALMNKLSMSEKRWIYATAYTAPELLTK
jgi:hypothetical protein